MELPWKLPLLLDGATGTGLMAAGMPADACVEQWVLEHPVVLAELQKAYADAGCDVVYASTFGAGYEPPAGGVDPPCRSGYPLSGGR